MCRRWDTTQKQVNDTPAGFESMKLGQCAASVCVIAALAGCTRGERGSISADAHRIRHHEDRGETTYNHSHTAAAIKQSKGEKEVCRK